MIDHTGQIWVSLFNETGVQLLGKTADEMMALKDENEDAFKSQLQAINFRTFNFKLRAKVDHWNDEAKLRTSVTGMFPLVPVDECKKLADKIELYL